MSVPTKKSRSAAAKKPNALGKVASTRAAGAYKFDAAAETMPRAEIAKLQLRRLKASVKNAYDHVPFHRRRLKALAALFVQVLQLAEKAGLEAEAQAAVDAKAQIFLAHALTPGMSDQDQLVPLIDAIKDHLGRKPKEASADAGYCSEANLAALAEREISPYLATGRAKHPGEVKRKITGPLTKAMRDKLKRAAWRSRYRLRKQIVEPVFGQIKQARGFRQFLLRGTEKVAAEWALSCPAHNLTKLARAA